MMLQLCTRGRTRYNKDKLRAEIKTPHNNQGSITNSNVNQRVSILANTNVNQLATQTNKVLSGFASILTRIEHITGSKIEEAQTQNSQNTSTHVNRQSATEYKPIHRYWKQNRTASHKPISATSQKLLADTIGRFFETTITKSQSRSSPHQVPHQPFANMSSASSSSGHKRSQERYISYLHLKNISHQEQILWVKIPPVPLGHLNGLDHILIDQQLYTTTNYTLTSPEYQYNNQYIT
jgi:hypothetical protein